MLEELAFPQAPPGFLPTGGIHPEVRRVSEDEEDGHARTQQLLPGAEKGRQERSWVDCPGNLPPGHGVEPQSVEERLPGPGARIDLPAHTVQHAPPAAAQVSRTRVDRASPADLCGTRSLVRSRNGQGTTMLKPGSPGSRTPVSCLSTPMSPSMVSPSADVSPPASCRSRCFVSVRCSGADPSGSRCT